MEKAVERKATAGPAQAQSASGQVGQGQAPQSSGGFTQYFSSGTLHIIAEIIALCGIVVYFSQKNAALTKHLEELSARVEEHEDILAKHDEVLKKIISRLSPNHQPQPQPQSLEIPKLHLPAQAPQAPTQAPQAPAQVLKTAQVSFTPSRDEPQKIAPTAAPAPNIMEMMGSLMGGLMPPSAASSSTITPSITEIDETTLDDELKEELANLH